MTRYLTLALAPGVKPERVLLYCNPRGGQYPVVVRPDGTHACAGCGRPVRAVT